MNIAVSFQNQNPVIGTTGVERTGRAEGEMQAQKAGQTGKTGAPKECQTCKRRKYQDGSNENVSFKSPTHIAQGAEATMVRAHEQEHVSNAFTKAAQKGNAQVISVGVSLRTAVCPECGRVYVAGGETTSTIRYTDEKNPYQKKAKAVDALATEGAHVDVKA